MHKRRDRLTAIVLGSEIALFLLCVVVVIDPMQMWVYPILMGLVALTFITSVI